MVKAAVCREHGQPLTIEEITLADPQDDEVKVKLAACAICHSDIFYVDGAWGGQTPAVYGHEAAGVVEAIGPGVTEIEVGDHVVVTLIRACGRCHYCVQGIAVACEGQLHLDREPPVTAADGSPIVQGLRTAGFAEEVTVHISQVAKVPDDLPLDVASLLACGVITGFGAVTKTAEMPAGVNAVVIGTGGVGLNAVQGAALSGAARVIAIDLAEDKLAAARAFGATDTIDLTDGDPTPEVLSLTEGRGADYVFVTVGAKAAFDQSFGLMSKAGTLVLVGMPEGGTQTSFAPGSVAGRSQRILGSKMGSSQIKTDIPSLVTLYRQGRLKLDELITNRYPLEQINEAIDSVKRGEALRNVIVF